MFKRAKDKRGFTLIELIVVIAILAILAAIAVPAFTGMSNEAKDSVTLSNAKMIAQAINVYNALNPGKEITDKSEAKGKLTTDPDVSLWPQMDDDKETEALVWVNVDSSGVATAAKPS